MKTYPYLLAIFFVIFLSSFGGTTRMVRENNVKELLTKVTPDSLDSDNDSIVFAEEEEEDNYVMVNDDTQASYYHDKFTGRKTASGEVFDNQKYTAAHKTLPFGTKVKVTNLKNKRFVILTITDRGPFVKGRGIDISKKAFGELTDNINRGVLDVKIEKFIGENEEQL